MTYITQQEETWSAEPFDLTFNPLPISFHLFRQKITFS